MRKATLTSVFLVVLLLAGVGEVKAGAEASLYMGRSYAGDLLLLDMNTFGGAVGAFAGPIGFELGLEYSPVVGFDIGPIGVGASIMNVMGNVVVQVPAGRFAPYGSVGYGAFIARAGIDPLPIGLTGTFGAMNFGFGGKIFLGEHIGLRVDYRRFVIQTSSDDLAFEIPFTGVLVDAAPDLNRFVGGVTFRF